MKRILFFVAPLCIALALYGFATTTVNTDGYNRNVYSYEESDAKIYRAGYYSEEEYNPVPAILVTLLTIFVVTTVARLMVDVAELVEIKKSNNKGKDI